MIGFQMRSYVLGHVGFVNLANEVRTSQHILVKSGVLTNMSFSRQNVLRAVC